jgi:hypothetical protein
MQQLDLVFRDLVATDQACIAYAAAIKAYNGV